MTAAESIQIYPDRVEKVLCVRTVGCDDWRAALQLRGELDLANVDQLRSELTRHLDAGRRVLRIDASAVSFIDSTALGALLWASQRCQAERGSLILTGLPARIQRVLTVSGLDQVLLVDGARR
jgi:anti-anti-sigma factor